MPRYDFSCPYQANKIKATASLVERVKNTIESGVLRKRRLVWLELNGCSGNIISLLDGENPGFRFLLSEMTDFIYCNSLSAAEGSLAAEQLFSVIGSDYILAAGGLFL